MEDKAVYPAKCGYNDTHAAHFWTSEGIKVDKEVGLLIPGVYEWYCNGQGANSS